MAYTYKGKTYKTKALMQKAQGDVKGTATKNTGSFFDKFIKGERFKKKDREKKYTDSKASVFGKKPAMLGDKGSPIPANLGDRGFKLKFKDAFNAAEKADRSKFSYKGKSYFTTKGAADNRDKMKTRIGKAGSMDSAKPTGPTKSKGKLASVLSKFKSSKTGSEFFKKLKKKK